MKIRHTTNTLDGYIFWNASLKDEEDKKETQRAWGIYIHGLKKRQAHLLYKSTTNKTLRENKEPIRIEPKYWEIPKGARLNKGFLYRGMTCPPHLGFLK